MRNRIWFLVVAFIAIGLCKTEQLSGQITSDAQDEYVPLSSYKGVRINRAYRFRVHIPEQDSIKTGWSLKVSVLSSSNGIKDFPVDKISLELNSIAGTNNPNISEVGVIGGEHPLSKGDVLFIENSSVKKYKNSPYAQWIFLFDLKIAGGGYLEEYKTWSEYTLITKFSLYNGGVMIAEKSWPLRMQIYPNDTPPTEPTYGIIVNTAARNGLLELKTMRDYIEGVSQTYKDGLSVISTTDYSIEVRSIKNNFEAGNSTLPVNAVSLELKDSKNNGGGTIVLSENTQTVFNTTATGKQARLFDIRYFTTPNDERLINATPASYQTTLMYTLVPQ